MNVWAVDWSLSTGVAFAWRQDRQIITLRMGGTPPSFPHPKRLAALHSAVQLISANVDPPTAVYVEQAVGKMNPRLLEAQGVVQMALWEALAGRTEFDPNVWLIRATEWRQALGIPRAEGGTKQERRRERKRQQKSFAVGLGTDPSVSEDEFDAACILRAGELDIGEERIAA